MTSAISVSENGWKDDVVAEVVLRVSVGAIGGRESGLGRRGTKRRWSLGELGGLRIWVTDMDGLSLGGG